MVISRLLSCAVVLAVCGFSPAMAQEEHAPPTAQKEHAAPVYRDLPLRTEGGLQVFAETADFRGPKGLTRLELYTLLDARQLQFVPENHKFVSQIDFTLVLRDSTGKEARRELWTRNISAADMQTMKEQGALVRDVVGFDIPPGGYHMTLTAEDIYGDRSGTCDADFRVRPFDGPDLAISDVEFATDLAPADSTGRFVKNSWRVVPNATRFYQAGDSLRIYFEIYNLKKQPGNDNDSFILGYSLVDTGGVVVKAYPAKRLLKPGESVAKTELLSTEGVSGGVYWLQVEAFDRSAHEHARYRRHVFLLSDSTATPQLSEEESTQLRYFKDIRYLATSKEMGVYNGLPSEEDKHKFLQAFWKKLDPTPETPLNERLREHMIREKYADDNFTSQPGKRGADTDKGRVYIKYGPPDEREYSTSAAGGKAVETWIYEKSGRYIFVFYDHRGTGVYELVHSTMSGEIYNPDWEKSAF